MLKAYLNIQKGNIADVPNNFLFPLMIWNSGNVKNLKLCNYINKHFFFVKPEILKGLLSLGIDKHQRVGQYPKTTKKDKDKKIELLQPYLKQIYGWSNRVFEIQKNLIDFNDHTFLKEISKKCGLNKKECKILGVEFKTFKVDKSKVNNKQKGLW